MLSIKTKIILANTLVFGTLLIVLAIVIYTNTRYNNYQKFNSRLRDFAQIIKVEIEEQVIDEEDLDTEEISAIPREGLLGVNIRLVHPNGRTVYADRSFDGWPTFRWANMRHTTPRFDDLEVQNEDYRCLTMPVQAEKEVFYALQVMASMRDVNADLDRLFTLFLVLMPLAFAATACAAYFISRAAFRPIAKITASANAMSLQNLHRRIDVPKAHDEVHELAKTLNHMIARLESAYNSQKRFVASASHELRTPLTIIQTELELAQKKLTDHVANNNIDIALAEIDSLSHLTSSLLLLSKLDAVQLELHKESVRLDELLIECVHVMRPTADKKGVALNITIEEAIEISADKEKLKRVSLNLLDNAIKYTSSPGSVTVVLHAANNGRVAFSISDSGVGINAKDLPFVFKRFYRSDDTRAEAPGSGLGLAIAQELVVLHGGTVSVDSTPQKGSTFIVELPFD
jgi:signal transduction histidine kinase